MACLDLRDLDLRIVGQRLRSSSSGVGVTSHSDRSSAFAEPGTATTANHHVQDESGEHDREQNDRGGEDDAGAMD